MIFCEEGKEDNFAGDPFEISDATSMLNYLEAVKDIRKEEIARAEADEESTTDS